MESTTRKLKLKLSERVLCTMTLHIAEISSGSKYFVASTYQVTTGLLGKLDHTHGTERLTVHETARPKRLRSTYSMNAAANQW